MPLGDLILTACQRLLLPAPPNMEEGQLLVQSGPDGALALAAIAGTLVEGEASPVLTLAVADGGDVGGQGAVVLACQAGSTWTGGDAKPWAEHPQAGCKAGGVEGTRSEGFRIIALPEASAGAIFHSGIIAGKLKGVMPATTPSGWRMA